jgi:hypothetical protein
MTTLTRYWPLDHTLESLSKPGAGVLVLVTSLVSLKLPCTRLHLGSQDFVMVTGVSLDLSSL